MRIVPTRVGVNRYHHGTRSARMDCPHARSGEPKGELTLSLDTENRKEALSAKRRFSHASRNALDCVERLNRNRN